MYIYIHSYTVGNSNSSGFQSTIRQGDLNAQWMNSNLNDFCIRGEVVVEVSKQASSS